MIDLHTHTERCGHAQGGVGDYVAAARATGIQVLAVTDHLPLPPSVLQADPHTATYAMPEGMLASYVAEVLSAREDARLSGGPQVLLGIEADHIPGEEAFTAGLLAAHPFDVVLGSVHMIDGWAFDDPDRMDGYVGRDIGELWDDYFARVTEAAASGMFDVLGHIDLVKKFRYYPEGDLVERYRALASAIAATRVAVEVNTAGLRKPCAELYPAQELLQCMFDAGVPVTIGSDAHRPGEVGYGYDAAVTALRAVGYRSAVVFEGRLPREVGL